jgi:hypothetical protein
VMTLSAVDVSKTYKQVNGQITRTCTASMRWPTSKCFHWHFQPLSVRVCNTKQITIVPVSKNTKVTCLNDYQPLVLTYVAMKCFERLVMAHINTIIPETLDSL